MASTGCCDVPVNQLKPWLIPLYLKSPCGVTLAGAGGHDTTSWQSVDAIGRTASFEEYSPLSSRAVSALPRVPWTLPS